MKKKIKPLIIVFLIVLVFLIIFRIPDRKGPDQRVLLNNWNDLEAQYAVCKISGEVESLSLFKCKRWFETEMSLDEMIESNKEDYVTTEEKFFHFPEGPVAVFFSNDNYYYILEQGVRENYYEAGNLCAEWSVEGLESSHIKFPFPERLTFDETCNMEGYIGKKSFDRIFDEYDFEYMKDFYSRISSDLRVIDEENQIVTIKAYADAKMTSVDSGYLYEIVIDCKNHTITGPTQDGGTLTLQ